MSEQINVAEQSQSIKGSIEECYLTSVRYLQLFKTAQRRHIGNESVYFSEFVGAFEALFILTSVEPSIRKEKIKEDSMLLIDQVEQWLNNGMNNKKEGEKLFLTYRKALFDRGILSFKP